MILLSWSLSLRASVFSRAVGGAVAWTWVRWARRAEFVQVLAQVVVQDEVHGVAGVPVQVDEGVEAPPDSGTASRSGASCRFAGGPCRSREEVLPQVLAEGRFDEAQVHLECVFAEGGAEELAEAGYDVVREPLAVQHGQDAVLVGDEAELLVGLHLGQVVGQGIAGVGQDEAGLVERVPAQHAADGIGEEGGHVLAAGRRGQE